MPADANQAGKSPERMRNRYMRQLSEYYITDEKNRREKANRLPFWTSYLDVIGIIQASQL